MATPSISDLQTHTGFWLRYVSNHVSHAFARKVETLGVTVAEWVILRELYSADAIAPSELAERTGLTRGAISKLADRLLAKKLITRAYSTKDRRWQTLTLTAAGRRLIPQLAKLADANDEEFFACLTSRERTALLETLKKLVRLNHLSTLPVD
ncbi:MAG TPA: MarR family transcriptional regulator [Acidobacteriaceae bacterium]|jgi:DNA-binding MarR family transcriptional regulator|nr:MarR family transcriptional regulator [Acidobacteriaceae bacterium]